MEKEYLIINECLAAVRQSDLQIVKKLRLEIKLIQVKRLLLDDQVVSGIKDDSGVLEKFEDLLAVIEVVCRTEATTADNTCLNRAKEILALLEGRSSKSAVGSARPRCFCSPLR